MSKETITIQVDRDRREQLDTIAKDLNCDFNSLLDRAIDYYLDLHQWQIEEIETAIAEAETGDFASEQEVNLVFDRLTNGNEMAKESTSQDRSPQANTSFSCQINRAIVT